MFSRCETLNNVARQILAGMCAKVRTGFAHARMRLTNRAAKAIAISGFIGL